MPVEPELIKLAYQLFLDREAESVEVIAQKAAALNSNKEVREDFMESREFIIKNYQNFIGKYLNTQLQGGSSEIEVQCTDEDLNMLFKRVEEQWTELGNTEPYWSVLTEEKYKMDKIGDNIDAFNLSGQAVIDLLSLLSKRNTTMLPTDSCFELGCGTGRITRYLSENFDYVYAADVSPGNLKLCRNYLDSLAITNVDTILIKKLEEIKNLVEFSVFISIIVLQHNPPPVQYYLLQQILSKIKSGGICLFQTPTFKSDYHFSIKDYLCTEKMVMDSHCLPMRFIMELLKKNSFSVLEVIKDNYTGSEFHSYTFFARKE
jgi:SAM-dependent methyltransferase